MKTLIATHGAIFIIGLFYIYKKHGVLPSISDSYYRFDKNAFFPVYISLSGLPLLFTGDGWFFFAGAALIFVGLAPQFREDLEGDVHAVGAVSAIVLGAVGLAFKGVYFPLVVVGLAPLLQLFKVRNATWWAEIICFAGVYSGLWTYIATNEGFFTR